METIMQIVFVPIGIASLGLILSLIFKGIDRRIAARFQARVGPPLVQPFRDIMKLMLKETIVPENCVRWVYESAPIIALVGSLMLLLYIPMGPFNAPLGNFGDLILVLYLFTIPSLAMVAGGFASGNPYATIGAQREMVMMMSYELPLAMLAAATAWKVTSFSIAKISSTVIWSTVGPLGLVGILLLLVVVLSVAPAELVKIPFDAPEAETEIAGGLLVDYSGRNLALFYLSDAVKSFAFASLIVALFFPFKLGTTIWGEFLWFLLKVLIVMIVSVTTVRVAAARLQIDNIAGYYWKPIALVSLAALALIAIDTAVVI